MTDILSVVAALHKKQACGGQVGCNGQVNAADTVRSPEFFKVKGRFVVYIIVYTIEGNSGDKVCERQYPIGDREILGYGKYKQPETSASGDTASQVWTYLKSYGYSDSVAAGIIGNMMRECGGDTLDLDWDIVGHFNGDEFYGLCQWCLRYTPAGFKNSTIKEQCDYLHRTIESEFATYGGNYNGITYSEFLKADTRTAAIAFERVYERCGDYANEDTRRANNAETAYKKFHK